MFYQSAYIEIVLGVFMLLFGVNFNLFFLILIGRVREELRWYLIICAAATGFIALNIFTLYRSASDSLRLAFFQVSSIMTTTGYATADFAGHWPPFSQHLLLSLNAFDFTTNFSAEMACINNIGPAGNFGMYSPFSKMLLTLNILLGRLEIIPLFVLFSPASWRRSA